MIISFRIGYEAVICSPEVALNNLVGVIFQTDFFGLIALISTMYVFTDNEIDSLFAQL